MLAGNNFTENFNADVSMEIFWNVENNIHNFLLANLSITIKSNEFVGKKHRGLIFQETKCIEEILENEITGEVRG